MNKQELARHMQSSIMREGEKVRPGYINTSQLAKYQGCSRDRIPDLVEGLPFFRTGREKKYFILDVAERLLDQRS